MRRANESAIDWREYGHAGLEDRLRGRRTPLSRREFAEIASEFGVDVLDYDTFFSQLRPEHRDGAPPRSAPIFALFNPNTRRPQVVINDRFDPIPIPMLAHALHMLKHEGVHAGQAKRRPDWMLTGGWDVHRPKVYFSNKDEIMAFSQSISDELITMGFRDPKEAIRNLMRSQTWSRIRHIGLPQKVLNRYRKQIYQYLMMELGDQDPNEVSGFSRFVRESMEAQPAQEDPLNKKVKADPDAVEIARELMKAGLLTKEEFLKSFGEYMTDLEVQDRDPRLWKEIDESLKEQLSKALMYIASERVKEAELAISNLRWRVFQDGTCEPIVLGDPSVEDAFRGWAIVDLFYGVGVSGFDFSLTTGPYDFPKDIESRVISLFKKK